MGIVFGERPRPWGLVLGEWADAELRKIQEVIPTLDRAEHLAGVDQREYDIALVREPVPAIPSPDLWMVSFASPSNEGTIDEGVVGTETSAWYRSVSWLEGPASKTVVVKTDAPQPLAQAAKVDLAPKALSRDRQPKLDSIGWKQGAGMWALLVPRRGHEVLAALYRRTKDSPSYCVAVPHEADGVLWVKAAMSVFRGMDANRFPEPQRDWKTAPEWQTPREEHLVLQLQETIAERERLVGEISGAIADFESQLSLAQAEADGEERRLLTTQDDELVSAVAAALRELGFEIRDMDAEWPAGDRREDLRVTDPTDDPDFIAIVEVRGYAKGGAAANDLLRIGRFASRFALDEGRLPTARWYVVNQFFARDPSERPPMFETNPAELATFAEDGGLAIDTGQLFKLWMGVRRSDLTATEARAKLRKALGRFVAA